MKFHLFGNDLFAGFVLLLWTASGQAFPRVSTDCAQINAKLTQAGDQNRLDETPRILSEAIGTDINRIGSFCAGVLATNVAALFETSDRPDEARVFAERAVA